MIRFNIVVLALAASVASVACGGSQPAPKDPSTDPNAPPPTSAPPSTDPNAAPTPGLGGTGTGSGQGQFGPGH